MIWERIIRLLIVFGVGFVLSMVIVAILRVPYCLYHSFTPRAEAPLICTV